MRKNGNPHQPPEGARAYRGRTLFLGGLFALWCLGLGGRLVQLSVHSDDRVARYSERQESGSVKIHLPRGMIYDRNGAPLAFSVESHSVYLNPRVVDDPAMTAARIARALEPESESRRRQVAARIARTIEHRRNRSFVWVERKVPPRVYHVLKHDDIPGVGFVKESKRFYPKRDVAAKIIGFCGIDNQGLYGLEYRYDRVIGPVSEQVEVLRDALGRPVSMPDAMQIARNASPRDLVLTIDERIQYVAEQALERQVTATGAKGGVAIVMDPNNGQILAMAEQPKFNPNVFANYRTGDYKSRAVTGTVEPGSVMKVFVAAAALEQGLTYPYQPIDCENGTYRVADHTFGEAQGHRYGVITLTDVIRHSSNIGAIKLAEKLGPARLYAALRAFGFGEKGGVDLPGEVAGSLRPVRDWSATSLPSLSFGQEIGVTPLQVVTGISAFANGGWLVTPRFVKGLARNGEQERDSRLPYRRRVVSEKTARTVAEMMRRVVEDGTGKMGAVPGFTVAGKTGTAQKFDRATGRYSETKFLSSFVGFFPVEEPRLSILVMIDESHGKGWGGQVAGPVFAEIGARAARILHFPSRETPMYEIDWGRVAGAAGPEAPGA